MLRASGLCHKLILLLLGCWLLGSLLGCAQKELNLPGNTEVEIWQLQWIGQAEGTLQLTLYRTKMSEKTFQIAGEMSGTIRDHRGGLGVADIKLKGKIEKNVFSATLSGSADMAEGPSSLNGSMKGSLANQEGSGTWQVAHNRGTSSGEFTMKRIRTSK